MQEKILGLDLSLKQTGVCFMKANGEFETFSVCPQKKISGIVRLVDIISQIRNLIYKFPTVEIIGIERPAYGAKFGRRESLAELHGAVKVNLWEFNPSLKFIEISPLHARKIVCGFGYKKKEEVAKALRNAKALRKMKVLKFVNDDEMDAFLVAETILIEEGQMNAD